MTEPALVPKAVEFYGDELVAVQAADGTIALVFARLCENLGLERTAQVRRVLRHAVLSEGLVTLLLQTERRGAQEAQCLRLDLLPLWLSSVHASRVKEEVRDKLVRYQHEAAVVLWQAFKPQILTAPEPTALAPESATSIAQLERIIAQSEAITRMAQEQIALLRRMDAAARVVRGLQVDMADVHVRLGVLEDRLHPASYITDQQAAEVSGAVKALAELLTTKEAGKNQYQGIFAALYRRFGVPSYKHVRQEQFRAVLAFLDEWHAAATSRESSAGG